LKHFLTVTPHSEIKDVEDNRRELGYLMNGTLLLAQASSDWLRAVMSREYTVSLSAAGLTAC
jgi:hypothetical protein